MLDKTHTVDFCVVGGGLAGMCAAISAARHGAEVALIQDRPVLGGNCSSEIRMWICGAHGSNNHETGIIEEILLENCYRNPLSNYSVWDSILYEKVRFEPNIRLLLNCSCNDIEMHGNRILAVKGWQLTTETRHRIQAKLFADCSGDSILAPLSGAEFRIGREGRDEFNENIAPPQADRKTMGLSCLIQARQTDRPQSFTPPGWAHSYETDDMLPNRNHIVGQQNFWWLEIGGESDSIHDAEDLRDELLKIAFGVWDHIKNHGDHGAENWALEWVGFLPGKRESRRYVGDYVLTQNDVCSQGRFDDLVAYGGWPMDDHHPAGFNYPGEPTIFHPAPSPFGIPYRCLYSRNIENLFFAGRNISATHAAMSSTRVMATCATLGQAVGTAAAMAVSSGLLPRDVYSNKLKQLKQTLMEDDCYLPWNVRQTPKLTQTAKLTASEGAPKALRNGIDRPVGREDNGFTISPGGYIQYEFDKPEQVRQVRVVFDSDLNRVMLDRTVHGRGINNMRCCYRLNDQPVSVPKALVKSFRIEATDVDGKWATVFHETNNYQRLVCIPLQTKAKAIRLIPETTWGAEQAHVFAWEVT